MSEGFERDKEPAIPPTTEREPLSAEREKEIEATFREKLKEAELYTASVIQDSTELVETTNEGGCHVYSVSKFQEALDIIRVLPEERGGDLLDEQFIRIGPPRNVNRTVFSSDRELPEQLGLSLHPDTSEETHDFTLMDHTRINIEIGSAGSDRLAQALADDSEIRALILGEEWDEQPLRSALLDGRNAEERKAMILSFLAEAKRRHEDGSLGRRGNRMWLVRVTPDEAGFNLISVGGEQEGIVVPLRPSEHRRPGRSVNFGVYGGLDIGYVTRLMERLGKNGLRASFPPAHGAVELEFNKSWIVNDDGIVTS